MFLLTSGHIEYLQNTASGATFADIALLLIDSKVGITQQTQNHLEIVNMFSNIKKLLCVSIKLILKSNRKIYLKFIKKKSKNFVLKRI